MLAIGSELGGDARVIGLTHACRLAIVLTVLPQMLIHFGGVSPEALRGSVGGAAVAAAAAAGAGAARGTGLLSSFSWPLSLSPSSSPFSLSLSDAALLVAAAAVGPALGRCLRLPARHVVGPMLCSAALHLFGATAAAPPAAVLRAAQCVIAASVGVKFAGTSPARVAATFAHALGSTGLLLVVAAACSGAVGRLTGTPWPLLLLAYSPGGVALHRMGLRCVLCAALCVAPQCRVNSTDP